MNLCVACKNATTIDRCDRNALPGLDVCGIHARAKSRRDWFIVNNIEPKIVRIQAVWKGYSLRNRLKRGGPGVLKRSICHNEDEFMSLEPIAKLDPRLYFGFEQDGKVWAFNVYGLCKILLQDIEPKNPYTRTPFSNDTRRRLRQYFFYLVRRRDAEIVNILRTNPIEIKLVLITQILHENGFEDFRPEYLTMCSNDQTYILRALLLHDMRALAFKNPNLRLYRYCSLLNSKTIMATSHPVTKLIHILLLIFADMTCSSQEYEFCFLIMSALFKI
jgi:hypothetical protein